MLQVMRDKVMGWLGWIIIGLVILTFALFGLGSYLQDSSRIYAAKVNNVEIAPGELQRAYQQQRAQLEEMLGENFDPSLISDKLLRQRALDKLVSRSLLLQAAAVDGMAISDQLLAAQIHAIPVFKEDGTFSEQRYQNVLSRQGLSSGRFEADTRDDLLADQLISGISRSEFVAPGELELAYALQHQQRDFAYVIVAAQPFEAKAEISDADIQDYYEQHGDELMMPERVRIEYVRLTASELSGDIVIDDAALQAQYELKKESLTTQEQRRASHILIQVASDADDAAVNAARTEAEELLARIRAGEDFATLAREHSDDPGSAQQGGDLGFFGKGAMVPEFEKTVFSLEKGAVSEPVRTQFGFHLIKLVEVQGSAIPPLDQVRDELIVELQKQQVDDLFYERLEHLTDLSYESPDSLDTVAEAMGLEIKTSDWLTASGGPGVGAYPNLVTTVFSEDVLESGNNSEPVEVGPDDAIVARVVEREAAHRPPLDKVKDQIVAALKKQQAIQQATTTGESLLQRLSQGAAMQDLQGEDVLALTQAQAVERSAPGYHPEIMRAVFKLPKPAPGESVDHGLQLANGDYAVVRLSAVKDGDPGVMSAEERQQIAQGYENLRQAINVSAVLESLRSRADIVIPSEQEE